MRRWKILLCLLVQTATLAVAQTDSNSVTVTSSVSTTLQPDQAVYSVTLVTPFTTGLNAVVTPLQGVGITASNLSNAYSDSSHLYWTFTLSAPIANVAGTLATLAGLQQTLMQQNMTLTFSPQGTQVSPQLRAAQTCSYPSLMADAQAQAQKLANAAGVTLGLVLAVSDGGSAPNAGQIASIIVPVAAERTGDFSGAFSLFAAPIFNVPVTCSMTVKFALLRY